MIGPLLAETLVGLGYEVCGVEVIEAAQPRRRRGTGRI